LSKYSAKPYDNRFGSWLETCKAFIKYKNSDLEFIKIFKEKSTGRSRTINEKTRLHVFKRDNYACRICGKSPATHRGITLHLDHIIAFSKEGANDLNNLRTLCDKCNLTRGNDESL